MNRPSRPVGIYVRWNDVTQPAIGQPIRTTIWPTRTVLPQRRDALWQVMHIFQMGAMQKFASQAKLITPHFRLSIPSIPLPQIMKPHFRGGLLPNFCRLVINAARDRRGMLSEVQSSYLLPTTTHDIW